MQSSFERIITGVIFFLVTIFLAVVGYSWLGWDLFDAFYMVVITIFGVGYGEVNPLDTPSERIFTIIVIFAGFISVAYIVGGFVQMMMEGEINRAFDAHRRTQDIANLDGHVVICGFGRVGQMLAQDLKETQRPFIVLDSVPEQIAKAEELGYLAYLGTVSDEDVLNYAGIVKAKTLAAVLADDALNVFITLTARELNPNLTILAMGELPSTEKKLRLAGADHVVLPAAISAQRMTNLITRPTAVDFLDQNGERSHLDTMLDQINLRIDELTIPEDSPLAGATLADIEVQGDRSFIILAVRSADNSIVNSPPPTLVLKGGDTVIVLGQRGIIPKLARFYDLKRNLRYRGARA